MLRTARFSVDLVYLGQTFEHVTRGEGRALLAEIERVLTDGGHPAVDTPNRAATSIELEGSGRQFIDPDHEVEYTHAEMIGLIGEAGLEPVRWHGLNYLGAELDSGSVTETAIAESPGLLDVPARCYLLAYVAAKPHRATGGDEVKRRW